MQFLLVVAVVEVDVSALTTVLQVEEVVLLLQN
jgi:hypothetical protein